MSKSNFRNQVEVHVGKQIMNKIKSQRGILAIRATNNLLRITIRISKITRSNQGKNLRNLKIVLEIPKMMMTSQIQTMGKVLAITAS